MKITSLHHPQTPKITDTQRLRQASHDLETRFISEMLKAAKISNGSSSTLTHGTGTDYFNDYLDANYAKAITKNYEIGLADSIFSVMKKRSEVQWR